MSLSVETTAPRSASATAPQAKDDEKVVTHFREILLWPVQLMPLKEGQQIHHHWELLECPGGQWEDCSTNF